MDEIFDDLWRPGVAARVAAWAFIATGVAAAVTGATIAVVSAALGDGSTMGQGPFVLGILGPFAPLGWR